MSDTLMALYILIWIVTSIVAVLLKQQFHILIATPMGKKATLAILWKSYTKTELFFTLSMITNLIEAYKWYDMLVFFRREDG